MRHCPASKNLDNYYPHTCGEYTKESLIYRHSYFENSAIFITLLLKHTPAIPNS
ncbi:hypothetical protein HMPREF0495_00626 [Levilactobacillus brevis ATCC 14869 = DSM 20054]|uniref:Uncharacterized protein n=1 Tax=Levilactobacillus brevis ATCC 14869 = DSM 20054 TaxID=649758 RepID=U2QU51_LEVBR|nr:hypothetical protein HMPREF0495_00626 [Levilactobacillus brevis ATCC 14869 = DSM 20054]